MARRAAGLAAPGALLAVAAFGANVLGYGLVVVLGRALVPADYGAVAALLNLTVIGAVPGLALQLVAARVVARDGAAAGVRAMVRPALVTGGLLAAAGVAAAPVLEVALRLDGPLPAVAVGAALLPTTVTFAVQGVLQGGERFGRLSLTYLVVAVPRFAAGAAGAVAGGVTGAVTGTLLAAVLAAVVALALLPRSVRPRRGDRPPAAVHVTWRDVLASAAGTAGLLMLANIDVLLARAVLPPQESGLYAAGSVFAKAAYWGPQFVSTLLYSRMAVQASRARAVWAATAVTAALGLVVVAAGAIGGGRLVALLLGDAYAGLGRGAAVFAALGAALAVVQVLVYAAIAVGDRRLAAATWLGTLAVAVVVVVTGPTSPLAVAGTVLAGALVIAAAGALLELRRPAPAAAAPVAAGGRGPA